MKYSKLILAGMLFLGLIVSPLAGKADEPKTKPKPYILKTCIVSGDKLGEMGAPYVFVQDGREIKLCCKGCLKDFKKDAAKYMKKIDQAEAKAAKAGSADSEAKANDKK